MALTNGMVPNTGSNAFGVLLYTSASNLAAGTVTSGELVVGPYTMADVVVNVTIAGTTTLNVYLQKQLADGTWTDIASPAQFSATGVKYFSLGPVINTADFAKSDAALAAGTIQKTLMGNRWRIKGVVAGAAPDATFSVYADFWK